MKIAKHSLQNLFSDAVFEGTLEEGQFVWKGAKRIDRAVIRNGVCAWRDAKFLRDGVWSGWEERKGPEFNSVKMYTGCLEALKEWGWSIEDIWTKPCAWPCGSGE